MARFLPPLLVVLALSVPRLVAQQPSAGTGTVMQTATLERYATEAGFASVEVLPIAHDMFRFYRLH